MTDPRILTVVGARPQFIKAAPVSRALKARRIAEVMVHTGQHFDDNMSGLFFRELDLPPPAYGLGIHGGGHGAMTGRMIIALEEVMLAERPAAVLLYGDTNSTLAGAVAAAKLDLPVAHVEAGLRSFTSMPEETNRILADRVSKWLFCPTTTAVTNLAREGITCGVHQVGDVMFDLALSMRERARSHSDVLKKLGLIPGRFRLATIHRAENTRDRAALARVLDYLKDVGHESPVVLVLHPRTRQAAAEFGLSFAPLRIVDPVGYLEMLALLDACTSVLTDSGGLQKEAYFFRKPCVTLRDSTEWVETIEAGWNRLWTEKDYAPRRDIAAYGGGHAADAIAAVLAADKAFQRTLPPLRITLPGRDELRLLILSHMYPRPDHPVGGIFVHEQAKALRAQGVDARILSGNPFWIATFNPARVALGVRRYRHERPPWSTWDTVPVMRFPYVVGRYFRPTIHAWTYLHGLHRVLARVWQVFPFDIVHAHTSFLDGTAAILASRAAGAPVVITEHMGPFNVLTRNLAMRETTRRAVTTADRVLAVGSRLKADMVGELGVDPGLIEVLPNGFDPDVFHLAPPKRRPDGLIRALWVGHHVEVKRVDRLLQAFARASAERPQLRLTLVGDGPGRSAGERLAGELGIIERVEFRPPTERTGIADTMRAHDFLVISSETETFGLVALEALACGIPVLSTACGGPQDVIKDPGLGQIVSNDVDGLARGLAEMAEYASAHEPARLASYARDHFAWSAIAGQLVGIYAELFTARVPRD